MSKYIDLLREHQPETAKKNTKKKNKTVGKKRKKTDVSTENPYQEQAVTDAEILDTMEALLEEQDTGTSTHTDEQFEDELLAEETEQPKAESNPNPVEIHKTETSSQAKQQKPALENAYGFDISAWLKRVEQTLASMFSSVHNDEAINIDILNEHLSILFDQIQTTPNTLDLLELEINKHTKNTMNTSHHADLVQKSVMMMLYSAKVGLQLKLQLQELLPHTVAAMLQHLGMATISENIRQKESSLSDDEINQIKQSGHTALGYLNNQHIQHEQLHLAIRDSSERYDGSGPKEQKGHDIAWIARLTSLLSMFEALIHFRPYRERLLPRDAIRNIVKHHKKEFDPEMLKALIESISLYPVGTYIQLNTGEIGQVINVHAKFPLRPTVYINMDKYGHAITERKIDLKKQPNLMIQQCMYEEGLEKVTQSHQSTA
ncbi:MAG TPA: hypothetical protein EYP39_08775 [Ghiorsea sp.]|nr:hypothetical protein [Ghiorsea sp.]HIP06594.1 hypothetical protein [Mariprofundaceae bacterium]